MSNALARQSAFGRRAVAQGGQGGDVLSPVAQKWDGITFYIPQRVENTAPTARRFQFFLAVERNIRGATARNETKFNFMASQFDIGATVKLDVCDSTKNWLDPESLQPNLVRTSIFKFTDGRALTAYGKEVKGYTKNWTNTLVDGVAEQVVHSAKRGHLRFVSTLLKVKPPKPSAGVGKTASFTAAVIITIPLEPDANGDDIAPKWVYANLITSPSKLIAAIIKETGDEPEIGLMVEEGGMYARCDVEGLHRRYKEWVRGFQFEEAVPKFKVAFVGINLDTILHNDLQQCRQMELCQGKMVTLTVPEYNTKFLVKVQTLTDLTHTDIAATYFNNHSNTMKIAIQAQPLWALPPGQMSTRASTNASAASTPSTSLRSTQNADCRQTSPTLLRSRG
jgi:hypothetical protein